MIIRSIRILKAPVAAHRARTDDTSASPYLQGCERSLLSAMLKIDTMLNIDSNIVRAWPRRILFDSRASRVKRKETESLLAQSERRKMMSVA